MVSQLPRPFAIGGPLRTKRLADAVLAGDEAQASSPAAISVAPAERFRLSDSLLQSIGTVVVAGSGTGCPDIGSRDGSLFASVDEPDRRWFLPALRLADPDPAFSFSASCASQDSGGARFDVLVLAFGLVTVDPDDVVAFRVAHPGTRVDPIPFASIAATVEIGYTAQDGTATRKEISATVAGEPLVATATLLGSDVLLAYGGLTAAGSVSLSLTVSYEVVAEQQSHRFVPWVQPDWSRLVLLPPRQAAAGFGHVDVGPVDAGPTVDVAPAAASVVLRPVDVARLPVDVLRPPVRIGHLGDDAAPATPTWVHQTAADTIAIDVGETYASLPYRPRYTLAAGGTTTIVVSRGDLTGFGGPQSEFVELDVLPDFAARYPSLRALYLGQVTGTVVAVPARYGIVGTVDGLAAACDAIVDPSPTSASGCRFRLAFGVAAAVPGVELARLTNELATVPSLRGRVSAVTLASRPAAGDPLALDAPGVDGVALALGATNGSFLITFDVLDQPTTPAIAAVNLLLRELSAGPIPTLTARLSFALDDVFEVPGASTVVLAFSTTVGQGDLAIESSDAGVRIANAGPVPLAVSSLTVQPPDPAADAASVPVDLAVPARSNVGAPAESGALLGADGALAVPEGGFDAHLADYVHITVANVQQLRLTVAVNATGLLGDGTTVAVAVTIALVAAPETALPAMTLTPTSAVQQTVWQVPLGSGVVAVPAAVTAVATRADATTRTVTLTHDFGSQPILTLTADAFAAGA